MSCCCFGIRKALANDRDQDAGAYGTRKSLVELRDHDVGVYIGSGVSYDFYEFETCEEINLSSSLKGVFSIVFAIHDVCRILSRPAPPYSLFHELNSRCILQQLRDDDIQPLCVNLGRFKRLKKIVLDMVSRSLRCRLVWLGDAGYACLS